MTFRQLDVGGIVGGQVVSTSQRHGIGPGPRLRFGVRVDGQRTQEATCPRCGSLVWLQPPRRAFEGSPIGFVGLLTFVVLAGVCFLGACRMARLGPIESVLLGCIAIWLFGPWRSGMLRWLRVIRHRAF